MKRYALIFCCLCCDVLMGSAQAQDAAFEAFQEQLPTLKEFERLRVIDQHKLSAQSEESSRKILQFLLADTSADVQRRALYALLAAGARGAERIGEFLTRSEAYDRAAINLARTYPRIARTWVSEAILGESAQPRPILGEALRVLLEGDPGASARALNLRFGNETTIPALLQTLYELALFEGSAVVELRLKMLERLLAAELDFEMRWRALEILERWAGKLPQSASVWLVKVFEGAPEWMLRARALEILGRGRHQREVLLKGLADSYPRVRSQALSVLWDLEREEAIQVAELATKDAWPFVRASAVRALRTYTDALPVVLAATHDRAPSVRVAAIHALPVSSVQAQWESFLARARSPREALAVRRALILRLGASCVLEARAGLEELVLEGNKEFASEAARQVSAEALRALARLAPERFEKLAAPIPGAARHRSLADKAITCASAP